MDHAHRRCLNAGDNLMNHHHHHHHSNFHIAQTNFWVLHNCIHPMSVNYAINEHARELLVYSRASDHSAPLMIVKARVVQLIHCSPRLELSLLGSAAISDHESTV